MAEWDLTTRKDNLRDKGVNPFDITKNPGKRGATESPETRKTKRANIDDWQVCEFVWAYLEGTKTQPENKNLTWEMEDDNVGSQSAAPVTEVPEEEVITVAEELSETED